MSRKSTLVLLATGLPVVVALALAQPAHAGPWSLFVNGGLSMPTGDFGSEDELDAKTGFAIGGGVDYRFNDMFAVGIDGSWNQSAHAGEGETVDTGGGDTYTLDEAKFKTWHVGAHGKYFIPAGTTVMPYAIAGLGVYNTELKWEEHFVTGGVTTTDAGENTSDPRFGGMIGLGGNFKVNEMIGVGVEGAYNFISQDKDAVEGFGIDSLQYMSFTAALIFNLGQ